MTDVRVEGWTGESSASRVDPVTGVREEVEFFGSDRLRMFGCRHLPPGPPVGGAVICSSLQAELVKNYRREVLLARALAQRGIAVQRFHYRGTGNSDGVSAEVTFETMAADCREAVARLRASANVERIAFVGTRWGGLIAADTAARHEDAGLVLWEPAVEGSRYFNDVFRSRLIRDLKDGGAPPAGASLVEQLESKGSIDVMGYAIDRPLYESAKGRSLAQLLGDVPRSILLFQIARTTTLRGDFRRLVASWEEKGFDVETSVVEEEPAWWFVAEKWQPEEKRAAATTLVSKTTDWIAARLGAEVAA